MIIDGFSMAGFCSFGPDMQRFGPCHKVNFIIGQNNSGKSNVLSYVQRQYPRLVQAFTQPQGRMPWKGTDLFMTSQGTDRQRRVAFGIGIARNSAAYRRMQDNLLRRDPVLGNAEHMQKFINGMLDEEGVLWFEFQDGDASNQVLEVLPEWLESARQALGTMGMGVLSFNQLMTGTEEQSKVRAGTEIAVTICKAAFAAAPPVLVIPAMRRIQIGDPVPPEHNGRGVIEELFHLQLPDFDEQHLPGRYDAITDLLRSVTGHPDLTIQIPHHKQHINVTIRGRKLPLASLGTGLEELLIIATTATSVDGHVICIEEPEIHLHPALQKRLILYLSEQSNNQYFISTHSASLLDACSDAAVFHIQLDNGESIVDTAVTSNRRFQICSDLGYRASDLLQANCVVWVEGPSDRVYVNYWIKGIDPTLIEGIHYSIMFHGGALRSHLTADDDDVVDFISLRRLNRHVAMLIDSDKASEEDTINSTKQRLVNEIGTDGGYVWVTKGREIENYVPADARLLAIQSAHRNVESLVSADAFTNALYVIQTADSTQPSDTAETVKKNVDKVAVARTIAKSEIDWSVLDLRERVTELVEYIRGANHLTRLKAP